MAVCTVTAACTELAPPDDTYTTVNKLSPASALPERWSCLDDAPAAPYMRDMTRNSFSFTGFVVDYRNLTPVAASLRACNTMDAACDVGVAQGVQLPPPTPTSPPLIQVQLPPQFQGYLRLTADQYIPYDYYVGGPVLKDVQATQPFTLVSLSSLAEFVGGLGVADPLALATLGTLAVQVFDCNNDPAPDVELKLTDQDQFPDLRMAQPWAVQDRIPVLNRPTDVSGNAGFIGLPARNIAVEARVEGRTFGSRSFRIVPQRLTTGTIRVNYDVGY